MNIDLIEEYEDRKREYEFIQARLKPRTVKCKCCGNEIFLDTDKFIRYCYKPSIFIKCNKCNELLQIY